MTTNTNAALPELQDYEIRKMAAIGPVHESSGLVERRPIEYRRELEDQFVRGFRAAQAAALTPTAAVPPVEPVAWRYIPSKIWGDYVVTQDSNLANSAREYGCFVEPLFTAPKAEPSSNLADEFTKELDKLSQRNYELRMENAALRAQAAPAAVAGPSDAERDAARYHWLRERVSVWRTNDGSGPVSWFPVTKVPASLSLQDETDAAIDADRAMRAQAAPQPAVQQGDAEDAARLDWLDQQCEAYGFQDIHEGNRWEISGPYANVRTAIDAERAARKQGANHD